MATHATMDTPGPLPWRRLYRIWGSVMSRLAGEPIQPGKAGHLFPSATEKARVAPMTTIPDRAALRLRLRLRSMSHVNGTITNIHEPFATICWGERIPIP
jgi:hypothetical protein